MRYPVALGDSDTRAYTLRETFPISGKGLPVEPVVRARRVTIVDVARHARVSTTTVSKVLRNAYGASPAMRVKVQQAIDELGYRPSTAARGMRGRTYTVGVMLPDIRNPFFADILDGFTERLHDSEYQVLHGHGCNSEGPEARVTEAMIDHGMDGLVLIAPVSPRSHLEHVARTVPTVVVGRHGHSPAYDTVTDDDHAGAHLVVAHLAGLGHRRIAHIEHHETDATRLAEMPNAIRANGYRDAMRAHGLRCEMIDGAELRRRYEADLRRTPDAGRLGETGIQKQLDLTMTKVGIARVWREAAGRAMRPAYGCVRRRVT